MLVMRDSLHTCHYIRTLQVTCFMTAVVKHVAHVFADRPSLSRSFPPHWMVLQKRRAWLFNVLNLSLNPESWSVSQSSH